MFRLKLLLVGLIVGGMMAVAAHLVLEFNKDSKALLKQDSVQPA